MTAYYNEIDPHAAAWLRELIRRGLIAPGEVDERSIEDVRPDDLRGFTQCHFFAGIGVWGYALRQAGWPDDRPVWTGSCPCQPFSSAGKGGGFADERHLWPAFFHLIGECRPPVILGEQVASKDGLAWLDLVQADLEGTNHTFGAVDTCAAGFGAPHIRQRLWWVAERLADADDERPQGRAFPAERAGECLVGADGVAGGLVDTTLSSQRAHDGEPTTGVQRSVSHRRRGFSGGLADDDRPGRGPGQRDNPPAGHRGSAAAARGDGGLAHTEEFGRERRQGAAKRRLDDRKDARRGEGNDGPPGFGEVGVGPRPAGPTDGFWRDADWLFCRDGKWRPVEPGTFPLAHGAPARVVRLRGYGNAIVAPAAQAFIEAYLGAREDRHLLVSEASCLTHDTGIFA